MSPIERSTIEHRAAQLAQRITDGERAELVQDASYMCGYWRAVATMAIEELKRAAGLR